MFKLSTILFLIFSVLAPMYIVTHIVNHYPFKNDFFNIFSWHRYMMLFCFFIYFHLIHNSYNKPRLYKIIIPFIILEQIIIHFYPNVVSLSILNLFLLIFGAINFKEYIFLLPLLFLKFFYSSEIVDADFFIYQVLAVAMSFIPILKDFLNQERYWSLIIFSSSFTFFLVSIFIPELNFAKSAAHFFLLGGTGFLIINSFIQLLKIEGKTKYFLWSFVLLGAGLRGIFPLLYQDYFIPSLHNSMGLWTLSFLVLLIIVLKRAYFSHR